MKNTLFQYMDMRFKSKTSAEGFASISPELAYGPIITVSRETGCSGNEFVKGLTVYLNRREVFNKENIIWKWVNKEIIFDTAKELKVHPSRVYKLFRGEPRKLMDEIVESLSTRYYISDRVVTKAVKEIMKKIANRGHVIILGRGGVGLTRHYKNALHIKLYAPKDWRIDNIKQKFNITFKEAEVFVEKTDRERQLLVEKLTGSKWSNEAFDITFNCMNIKREYIYRCIESILRETK